MVVAQVAAAWIAVEQVAVARVAAGMLPDVLLYYLSASAAAQTQLLSAQLQTDAPYLSRDKEATVRQQPISIA